MANHKELCERLRAEAKALMSSFASEDHLFAHLFEAADLIESQAARIQQQALDYVSLQAQCDEHLARIAELEKERDALHENARQFYNLTQGDVTVIIRAPSAEKRNAIITASNRLRAALQAEKETRS